MALKVATIERQRTLAGLAKTLYAVKDAPELQKKAEEALVRANPHLAEEGKLKSGETVVVPDVKGLDRAKDATARFADDPLGDRGAERLRRLSAASEKLAAAAAKAGEAAAAALKDRTFTAALAKTHPELKGQVADITAASKADADRLVLRTKQLQDAIKLAEADRQRLDSRNSF